MGADAAGASGGRPFDLTGKVAIVSGAGGHVARAILGQLVAAGATLAVHRDSGPGTSGPSLASSAEGLTARAYDADLTHADQAAGLISLVERDLRSVDIAVRLSVRPAPAHLLDLAPGDWDRRVIHELRETFQFDRAAVAAMTRQGYGGRLLHVIVAPEGAASSEAFGPAAIQEGALIGMTHSLAVELGPHDINANVVVSGPVEAPGAAGGGEAGTREAILGRIPKGRFAHPCEVASLVVYLASDEADFLTGSVYRLDGGGRVA